MPTSSAERPHLEISGLSAGYGQALVIRDIDITVEREQIVSVIGPNGAGKSTLLKAILGVIAPAQGKISLEGELISGLRTDQIARRGVGYVPQVKDVFDTLTVRVVMKQAFSPFAAILTDRAGMMLPPRAAEAGGKDFGLHPVCAGPFRFVERVAQDHIALERFPGYWDAGRIHYDRVTYRIIPDSSIRLANLQAGTLDLTVTLGFPGAELPTGWTVEATRSFLSGATRTPSAR